MNIKSLRSLRLFACPARAVFALKALVLTAPIITCADEGMWLFNNPPRKLLQEKYGFEPSDAWLEHLQKSSVRFNSGGSGSFVSEDGLALSNHHVGADALQKFGDKDHNYIRDGFYARTRAEEKRCLDLELNVLMSIEDVTARVNEAVKPDATPEQAFLARRAVMAGIEKESLDKTGLRSDVVTLYQGAQYHLYRFKKYTDVRLVFAPEQQIAFFGGDPDNFEYPRYNLDICLFRAYEDGHPAKIPHHLSWSKAGAADNELVFVSGHPGRTSRLLTVAELEYVRDVMLPTRLERLKNTEVLLAAYSERSEENARRAREDFLRTQNSRKALDGELAGILDPTFIADKKKVEQTLKEAAADTAKFPDAAGAWDRIAQAQQVVEKNNKRFNVLEGRQSFNSQLYGIARTLLRAGEERPKPNAERLREFGEAGRESLEFQLFSEKPIYDDLEQLTLADSLTYLVKQLGYGDPLVQQVLAGKSPRERASELVLGTKVKSVELRKRLYQEGAKAVAAAHDPMIELASLVDPEARSLRKIVEEQDEIKQQAHAQIGKVRFAVMGTSQYPDATFTLRLAFGVVKGYEENGQHIPFETKFAGLYQRAGEQKNRSPFDLPERWTKRESHLDLKTPFNFVNTADIIGGNSGSPVVNRKGEFVGIIFDGNIQSLVGDFYYTEVQSRALAVHSQGIIEALRKLYDAGALADELQAGIGARTASSAHRTAAQ
ncbi:MAG: serine protease [Verrucomicrobia bacterium]|nr:MAG: serine protease [Verrucomicrobiota bacterium]